MHEYVLNVMNDLLNGTKFSELDEQLFTLWFILEKKHEQHFKYLQFLIVMAILLSGTNIFIDPHEQNFTFPWTIF